MDTPAFKSPSIDDGRLMGDPRPLNARGSAPESRARDVQKFSNHLGVTDDQVSRIAAPAGDAFDDEPRQG